jgi:iron complex transport system substrate-binding protein
VKPALLFAAVLGVQAWLVAVFAPDSGMVVAVKHPAWRTAPDYQMAEEGASRTAVDTDARRVRVKLPARRLVSQYWSIDEFLYALVPPEHVAGVSENAYVERLSNVLSLARRFRPVIATEPERVLMAGPGLIFVSSSARADYTAAVRSTGTPVFRMFTMFGTLGELEQGIRLVGHLTGSDASARSEIELLRQSVRRARQRRPPEAPAPRVLGLGGRYTYGSETLFHDIVHTLGAINVAAESGLRGYETVAPELILLWKPEWIVCGADPGRQRERLNQILADPALSETPAARSGRIVVFENRVFLSMSPFVRFFIEALGEALYGKQESQS